MNDLCHIKRRGHSWKLPTSKRMIWSPKRAGEPAPLSACAHIFTHSSLNDYLPERDNIIPEVGKLAFLNNKEAHLSNLFLSSKLQEMYKNYSPSNEWFPPFNQKDWREPTELLDDPRWKGFKIPPTSNANYAWILNIYSKLSTDGTAGFLLANGALSGDGDEKEIRSALVGPEHDAVEAIVILPRNMFYTTDISVTLWILNRNKKARTVNVNGETRKYRDRAGEILFMDLRTWGEPFEKKYVAFSGDDIKKAAAKFHQWQRADLGEYQDIPEFCKSVKVSELKDTSLVPSKYIEFVNKGGDGDYESKMNSLQKELGTLMNEEAKSRQAVLDVFKELGFEIHLD